MRFLMLRVEEKRELVSNPYPCGRTTKHGAVIKELPVEAQYKDA
ncbi:MAG: hypothetical protein CM15mP125_1030 [Gammaproteobacteria bacterium]|jgi:hypothetical protein|nr:MAG: hypothetical protein CM15mP125_1030 [Gammaproteobacteria bacterium]